MQHEDEEEASRELVSHILLGFGTFVLLAGFVAGPILSLDLGFLTARDMMLIATVMLALGGWLRGWVPGS